MRRTGWCFLSLRETTCLKRVTALSLFCGPRSRVFFICCWIFSSVTKADDLLFRDTSCFYFYGFASFWVAVGCLFQIQCFFFVFTYNLHFTVDGMSGRQAQRVYLDYNTESVPYPRIWNTNEEASVRHRVWDIFQHFQNIFKKFYLFIW